MPVLGNNIGEPKPHYLHRIPLRIDQIVPFDYTKTHLNRYLGAIPTRLGGAESSTNALHIWTTTDGQS